MPRFFYFAYGSNMLTERLLRRCDSARVIGPAFVAGREVTFHKRGYRDGSGKAILSAGDPALRHYGVLFEIASAQLDALDRFEGVGAGYEREDSFPVRLAADGAGLEAVTYRATAIDQSLMPFNWYLALVLLGAIEHGLPQTQIERFRRTPCIADPDPGRPGRQEALAILRALDCGDPTALLGGRTPA